MLHKKSDYGLIFLDAIQIEEKQNKSVEGKGDMHGHAVRERKQKRELWKKARHGRDAQQNKVPGNRNRRRKVRNMDLG